MSSQMPLDDVARLVTMFNSEIKVLLDDLKCGGCESVLTDACQLACGCRFCRTCIDDMEVDGTEFCPGSSNQCGATTLSTALPDYNANRTISMLTAKCAQSGCTHEFLLDDMGDHSSLSNKNMVDCPFREWECLQYKLAAGGMTGHSDILSGFVANINEDAEDTLINESGEQVRHVQNEIKLMRNKIKSLEKGNESIKEENEILADRVKQMAEKQSTEMELVINDIQLIQVDIASMKAQKQNMPVQLGPDDASCDDWVINYDLGKHVWERYETISGYFWKGKHPHKYQLASNNYPSDGELRIYLRIVSSVSDSEVAWPFRGAITVVIAQKDKREICCKQTRRFEIRKPPNNDYSNSDSFVFPHSALRGAGLNLGGGVRVWCNIK